MGTNNRDFFGSVKNFIKNQFQQISHLALTTQTQNVSIDELAEKFCTKIYDQQIEEQEFKLNVVRYEIQRPVGVSQLKKVSSPQKYPYNCIITISDKQQKYLNGTGFLISPSLVLTAAHNLVQPRTQSLQFEVKSFGEKINVLRHQVSRYYNNSKSSANNDYDYALIQLQSPIQRQRYLDLSLECKANQQIHLVGYPCSRRGQYQMATAHGIMKGLEKQSIRYNISTLKGMSGAPLVSSMNRFQIIAMHCGAITNLWNDTEKEGIRWSEKKINQLNIFMRELRIRAELKLVPQQFQKSGRRLYRSYSTSDKKKKKKELLIQFYDSVKYYKEVKDFERVLYYYEKIEELLANKPKELAVFIMQKSNHYYEYGYLNQSLKHYLKVQDILTKVTSNQTLKLSIVAETIDKVKRRISASQLLTTFPSTKYFRQCGAQNINLQPATITTTQGKKAA